MREPMTDANHLKDHIRTIPDFPQPGIMYRDITPLLAHPAAFKEIADRFAARYATAGIEGIVAIESRGFMFAAPVAYLMGLPFITARKVGKLPFTTVRESYALEYGEATLEMHTDALTPGQRVLILDDLIATGGTVAATAKLVEQLGGVVAGTAFVIELAALNGRAVLSQYDVFSLIQY